ncbi:hypothetical protein OJF2_37670 [Aquisphaera giovannonii]|uniref:Uncharacterized protein n=1 Tax=Aquisphaera giovannonii TaxID=406548 RepID=A0A5B9W5G4_9BACT|nr:hypothetical protein OJF2_37670 [Aquisphaera giovannonii]
MTVLGLRPATSSKTRRGEALRPRTGRRVRNGTAFASTFAVENR